MRVLTLVHRWFGILFCLLFAMWFASGIVMHFVPFPALTNAERIEGLAVIGGTPGLGSPAEAAGVFKYVARLRLLQRVDRPVYLVPAGDGTKAFAAADLSDAAIRSDDLALAIATDHARRRNMDATRASAAELIAFDQWTVSGSFNRHRPLYRIALNDAVGTELYVSSSTGEVVGDTTRHERGWNYVGSVAHWIYPTQLRSRAALWNTAVWSLSLAALTTALAGSLLGVLRIAATSGPGLSPYPGWHKWHHLLGLCCMIFVVSWIFSGWLSLDSGRLFSTGAPDSADAARLAETPAWSDVAKAEWRPTATAREIEWFGFAGKTYRRERTGIATQQLFRIGVDAATGVLPSPFLPASEISVAVGRIRPGCESPTVVAAADPYAIRSSMPGAPVYRSICGDIWYHIDGADGVLLERSDRSRRAYRWLYGALHTLDIPALQTRPTLRSALIVILCGLGFAFSLTGVVIGWRRLRQRFSP